MNKYETGRGVSRDEQAVNHELSAVFREFRDIVLMNKDYKLGKAKDILDKLNESEAKKIFELFNYQEGALPDELAVEYIKLVYSPISIKAKMDQGKTYYEALSAIAWEIKNAHIELNTDLVQERIKLSTAELKID